jgi:response regulator RpfG family c-di-GMP phosphodiesterase
MTSGRKQTTLSKLSTCRLCWKVTIAVFFAILCIEAAILFFSVNNFERDRLLEIEREAIVVMRSILRASDINGTLSSDLPDNGKNIRRNSVLAGAVIFDLEGNQLFNFGEPTTSITSNSNAAERSRQFHANNNRMDILMLPAQIKAPYFINARLDSSEIESQVTAFIWRITGLVLLITVFVTIVTMIVLEKLVLSPIRILAGRMTLAGTDPNNPKDHVMSVNRKDEWGDIVHAFNLMLNSSDEHLAQIKQQALELRNRADELDAKVQERTREVRETQFQIIHRLGRAGEYRDNETGTHVIRMSRSCQILALSAGLGEKVAEQILYASPMHDVGKIGIRDDILLKPGKLTKEEFEIMKTHAQIGADIIGNHKSPVLKLAREIALSHHEKWDGSGYPRGLTGEDIPLEARIVAICDVFDALTSKRPYKEAWSIEKAISFMKEQSGQHFDPKLIELFIEGIPKVQAIMDEFSDD